ncbi:MAG: IS1380 family transposase [Bacteroidetes bacterium]|nr:IS1380 family transposase [Bacteroidota bacterium]
MHKITSIKAIGKQKSVDFLLPSLFNLSKFNRKKVEVRFNFEQVSNDGGLLLLNEVDNQIGLIGNLAACINDKRHQGYVKHSIEAMLRQRIMQIAAGYEDGNDCNTLRNDGILKICSKQEQSLATQPTMSRFENQLGGKELYNMAKAFVDQFIASYTSQPEAIILDCDDTSALTYGQQELALFNTYYGDNCYMPLHIYEGLSGKLITTILKPGRRSKSVNVFAITRRLIDYLRQYWPKTIIILRGDSHFCSKEFMDWAEGENNVEFITGLAGNAVLNQNAMITIESAQREYNSCGKPIKRYHSFEYQANTWEHPQRVVVKVEVNSMGTNIRYITSSMRCIRTKALYENAYCARGAAELRIKDHKTYLLSDRMSCSSFLANQFRLFMHSAAYVLIHTLQKEVLTGTEYCKATMKTIQLKLIKAAARVKILKTKVQIELPAEFYSKWAFERCFRLFEVIRV